MASNTTSLAEDQERSRQGSDLGNSTMADTSLVATPPPDEQVLAIGDQIRKEDYLDRLALIRAHWTDTSMPVAQQDLLFQHIARSTTRRYDRQWKIWVEWCFQQEPVVDPLRSDPIQVIAFLMSMPSARPGTLNGYRSALASVFKILHPHDVPLGEKPLIKQFFQAKRRTEFVLPRTTDEIWDVGPLLKVIKSWGPTNTLLLPQLQRKTVLLLTLATMWRPRSDIANLQHQDVTIHRDHESQVIAMTVIARFAKETTGKTSKLGNIADEELCPVQTTAYFLQKTETLRPSGNPVHTLFAKDIGRSHDWERPAEATVATWIEQSMAEAGIDTARYKAHSTRAAASTAAVMAGQPINTVKRHANWSLRSNTFEQYYFRPNKQHQEGAEITEALFAAPTDKGPTSEDGVETTPIVLATATHNHKVAETKSENVGSRPETCTIS